MFTGIIQKVGTLTQVEPSGAATRLRVATSFTDLESGESVAVNGVCLTVTESDQRGSALFFVSPETLAKSNLGNLLVNAQVNLERALTLNTRLSGHLVQGHVDGMGKFLEATLDNGSYLARFEIPQSLARYCVDKGSIAINGVSLTINSITKTSDHNATNQQKAVLAITLIPHTWAHTQFSQIAPGDAINVEVDVLAKYVESLTTPYSDRFNNPYMQDFGAARGGNGNV
jgi:riboflavin synthase